MDDFRVFSFAAGNLPERSIFVKGDGPPVVVLHELPGLIPECVDLARRLVEAGFTVYLPLLFGQPAQPLSLTGMLGYTVQLCIRREFYLFARHQSSPITHWLRSLCRHIHQQHGGPGVGVIGMCLTGGFALTLMADASVIAPVASQPSLPFGLSASAKAALGIDPADLSAAQARSQAGVPLLALRFSEDRIAPAAKLGTLRQALGDTPEVVEDSAELCWRRGPTLETIEINSAPGNPYQIPQSAHAVLTLGYEPPPHPAHRVFERVVAFLWEQFEASRD